MSNLFIFGEKTITIIKFVKPFYKQMHVKFLLLNYQIALKQ